jgi:hypothetical protein
MVISERRRRALPGFRTAAERTVNRDVNEIIVRTVRSSVTGSVATSPSRSVSTRASGRAGVADLPSSRAQLIFNR